jgi:hypothetical protein
MIMGAHESLSRTYGVRAPLALRLIFEEFGPLERARALLETADFEEALEQGRRMHLEEVVALIAELQDQAAEQSDAR